MLCLGIHDQVSFIPLFIRVFTFGVGSGVSTELVKGIARAGNGRAEFVYKGERIQPKVPCCMSYIHTYTYSAMKSRIVVHTYQYTYIHTTL